MFFLDYWDFELDFKISECDLNSLGLEGDWFENVTFDGDVKACLHVCEVDWSS